MQYKIFSTRNKLISRFTTVDSIFLNLCSVASDPASQPSTGPGHCQRCHLGLDNRRRCLPFRRSDGQTHHLFDMITNSSKNKCLTNLRKPAIQVSGCRKWNVGFCFHILMALSTHTYLLHVMQQILVLHGR